MNKQKAIVLDLDDCCFDFIGTLCVLAKVLENTTYIKQDLVKWELPEELQTIFRKYEREIYLLEPMFKEAKIFLTYANTLGIKIIFMTARDEKYKKETELSLAMNEITYEEICFNKNKALKINRLSDKYDILAFADDKASTINKVKKDTTIPNVYLIDMPSNRNEVIEKGVIRIYNIEGIKIINDTEWKLFLE